MSAPHNKRMQAFLLHHGIKARAKWLADGSLKRCWRLVDPEQKWTPELTALLNALGFRDFDGKPLAQYSGNGGIFAVFVRGHDELLTCEPVLDGPTAPVVADSVPARPVETAAALSAAAGLIERARALWAARCADYMATRGDAGTCVLGAAIAIDYRAPGHRVARPRQIIGAGEVTGAQGSLVWEHSVAEIVEMLKPALPSVYYACGRMD